MATSPLRPPMAYLSHNSSDTPGLAPHECFILRAMRLSNKLLGQGYVKERLKSSLRKFYGRYGDLTKQYEVPLSRMLHDILDDDHIQWHPPLIGHYTHFWPSLIWTLYTNLTFYHIVQGFHRTYATDAACQQRTLTPPDTWSCPTLGLLVSGLLNFEHPSVLLFCSLDGVVFTGPFRNWPIPGQERLSRGMQP